MHDNCQLKGVSKRLVRVLYFLNAFSTCNIQNILFHLAFLGERSIFRRCKLDSKVNYPFESWFLPELDQNIFQMMQECFSKLVFGRALRLHPLKRLHWLAVVSKAILNLFKDFSNSSWCCFGHFSNNIGIKPSTVVYRSKMALNSGNNLVPRTSLMDWTIPPSDWLKWNTIPHWF